MVKNPHSDIEGVGQGSKIPHAVWCSQRGENMYTHTYTHIYVLCVYIECVCVYIYIVSMYIYMCIYTYVYICMYVWTERLSLHSQ